MHFHGEIKANFQAGRWAICKSTKLKGKAGFPKSNWRRKKGTNLVEHREFHKDK